jgi:hypothetical protein
MEVAAIALQQASAQTNATLAMVKQNAQTEQALIEMIAQSSPSGSRGQNLDITV